MNYTIKINNVKPDEISFTNKSENVIYSGNITEDISGLVSIDIGYESILCEKVHDNYVRARLSIDGDYYDNIYFKVLRGKSEVFLSKNYSGFKPPLLKEEADFDIFVANNNKANNHKHTDTVIESLRKEVYLLRQQLQQSKSSILTKVQEKLDPIQQSHEDYKLSLLKEQVNFAEKQKQVVKESIKTIYTECINEFTQEINNRFKDTQHNLSTKFNTFKNDILTQYNQEKIAQGDVLTEKIDDYSTYIRDFVRDSIKTAQSSFNNIFEDKIKQQEQLFVESSTIVVNDFKEKIKTEYIKENESIIKSIINENIKQLDSVLINKIKELSDDFDRSIGDRIRNNVLFLENSLEPINSKIQELENKINSLSS